MANGIIRRDECPRLDLLPNMDDEEISLESDIASILFSG